MAIEHAALLFWRNTTGLAMRRLIAVGLGLLIMGATAYAEPLKHGPGSPLTLSLPASAVTLPAKLLIPEGTGTGAALVLWPDCRGIKNSHRWWAKRLTQWGYRTLLLERPALPGVAHPCTVPPAHPDPIHSEEERWLDAAFARLAAAEGVDSTRIGLIGWSMRATLHAMTTAASHQRGARFRAGVAFYPDCRAPEPGHFAAPTLVLAGGRDVWIEPQACSELVREAEHGRAPLVTRIFAGVGHDFDHGVMHPPMEGNTYLAADQAASLAALHDVRRFLRQNLLPELQAAAHPLLVQPKPTWSADPAQPGENIPASGRSLLDYATRGGSLIAYPFKRLLDQLGPYAGPHHYGRPAIKQVLFPLGRSLQRHANAPDYFASPRIVVAIDTEPGSDALPSMKDRLFLGFQPRAGIIEAISWNPALGRFEFQVIRNYRAGEGPRLVYAQRSVCLSCHQNAGPLFARAPWSESNANPRIFNRLAKHHSRYQGRTLVNVEPTVEHVDAATDRGAMLVTWQRLWRDACGPSNAAGYACRGAALVAMLQHRLTDGAGHDRTSMQFRAQLLGHQRNHWRANWRHGLAVPTADLIDHDALAEQTLGTVPSFADPLRPRAPAEYWPAPNAAVLERFIAGLGEQIPATLISRLDRVLGERDAHRPIRSAPIRSAPVPCSLSHRQRADGSARWRFDCLSSHSQGHTRLEGTMVILGSTIKEGRLDHLTLGNVTYHPVLILGGRLQHETIAHAVLSQQGSGLRVRTPKGNLIRLLEVDLAAGLARTLVSADFKPVLGMVEDMVATRAPALDAAPFSAEATLNALLERLGMSTLADWPTGAGSIAAAWPPPELDDASDNAVAGKLLAVKDGQNGAVLARYCGRCHAQDSAFPPGFLHGGFLPGGGQTTVAARIQACAPRMLYRLRMWDLPATQRGKSPMPPAHSLATFGSSPRAWRSSAERAQLIGYLQAQVPERLRYPGPTYAQLPSCGHADKSD